MCVTAYCGVVTTTLDEQMFGSAQRLCRAIDGETTIFAIGRKNAMFSRALFFNGLGDGILLTGKNLST